MIIYNDMFNVAFSLTPSHASERRRPPSMAFEVSNAGNGLKNLAFLDFSSIQSDAVNRGRSQSTAVDDV